MFALGALVVGGLAGSFAPRAAVRSVAPSDALLRWVAQEYRTPGSDGILADPLAARGVPDPQKYVWPKVIARLARDPSDRWSRRMVAQFWDAGGEPAPHAASFYHFAAYGLVRILYGWPEAVGSYREGILARAMGEEQLFTGRGTENHIAMWRTSGYLLAEAAGDRNRMAQARQWIVEYSDRLYTVGQGEFDSSTYAPFTVASWLNLVDYARDAEVRHRARAVVDYLAASLALRWCNGAQAGGEKRGFGGSDRRTPASYLGWVWWGDGSEPPGGFSQAAIHSVVAAVSRYRPPAAITSLARIRPRQTHEEYRGSKPDYAMRVGNETRECLYITPHYSVGVLYSPTGGWGGGETQETLWKMAALLPEDRCAVISGAGAAYAERKRFSGEGRSPWDQVAHCRDMVVQLTRVPNNAEAIAAGIRAKYDAWRSRNEHVTFADPSLEPWCYATVPADARLVTVGAWLFVDMGATVYAALRPIGGSFAALERSGSQKTRSFRVVGRRGSIVGVAYEFGDRDSDGSFAGFVEAVTDRSSLEADDASVTIRGRSGRSLQVRFGLSGRFRPPAYDWGTQPRWPRGEGHGRLPEVRCDGRLLNLRERWPVYEGPRLSVRNGELIVRSRADAAPSGSSDVYRIGPAMRNR